MQKLEVYQTDDGVLHLSHQAATRHADNRYGELLCKLARGVVKTDWKYTAAIEFIEAHLSDFVALNELHKDRELSECQQTF